MGELEDAVMTRVWKWNRPVTVREVLEDLQQERSIAYTTVMTVLDNLHQKGWVRREAEGRAYRYEAVSTRAAYAAALMNDAWSQSDNPAAALVAFFGMMSDEQRQALGDAMRIVQGPASTPEPEGTETAPTAEAGDTESTPAAEPGGETASAAEAESTESAPPSDRPAGSAGDKPGGTPGENPGEMREEKNPASDGGGTGR
ncbi:BlaI/MecI/CopY family transcriptional regulator [Streptomyces sp. NPDC047079]|uniref:BlaI/MecI/CopY family transcriptional regulator n=1 Tax=Streptomyces sp. NPDC047079 TaxID=3154607 RepID=UPI0033E04F10